MREQLRLRVLLPLAVLGLLGAGAAAFAFGGSQEQEDSAANASLSARANGKVAPARSAPAAKKGHEAAPKLSPLERELWEHRVVVAVLYAPGSSVDRLTIREARAGAQAAGAGFVALDVSSDRAIDALAAQYNLRAVPAVLVLARGPRVVTQFKSYKDRETVAQAANDARA